MNNKTYGEETVERQSNGKLFVAIIAFLIFIVCVIGMSVATVVYTKEGNKVNTISTGNIYLNYTEDNNGISITDAYPMTDDLGKKLVDENQYFDFSVVGSFEGNFNTIYEISAEKVSSSTLSNEDVKLYLEKKDGATYTKVMEPTNFTPLRESTDVGSAAGSMLLYTSNFEESETVNYRLRMWVDSDTKIEGVSKSFAVKVVVKAKVDLDKDYHHHK